MRASAVDYSTLRVSLKCQLEYTPNVPSILIKISKIKLKSDQASRSMPHHNKLLKTWHKFSFIDYKIIESISCYTYNYMWVIYKEMNVILHENVHYFIIVIFIKCFTYLKREYSDLGVKEIIIRNYYAIYMQKCTFKMVILTVNY